jgi:hypothetical protein
MSPCASPAHMTLVCAATTDVFNIQIANSPMGSQSGAIALFPARVAGSAEPFLWWSPSLLAGGDQQPSSAAVGATLFQHMHDAASRRLEQAQAFRDLTLLPWGEHTPRPLLLTGESRSTSAQGSLTSSSSGCVPSGTPLQCASLDGEFLQAAARPEGSQPRRGSCLQRKWRC